MSRLQTMNCENTRPNKQAFASRLKTAVSVFKKKNCVERHEDVQKPQKRAFGESRNRNIERNARKTETVKKTKKQEKAECVQSRQTINRSDHNEITCPSKESTEQENLLDVTELNDAIDLILSQPPEGVRDIDEEQDPLLNTIYAQDIFNHLQKKERSYYITEDFLDDHGKVTPNMRGVLYDWLIQVQVHLNLEQETLHLTTTMVDRFLQLRMISLRKLQLVGITCLFIAAKYLERYTPAVETLIHLTDNTYTHEEVIGMEIVVLKTLNFDLNLPEPVYFADRFIKAVTEEPHPKMTHVVRYLLDLSLPHIGFVTFSPSVRAAAAVLLAFRLLDSGRWTPASASTAAAAAAWNLSFYSGHVEHVLRPCMKRYAKALLKCDSSKFQGARNKYADAQTQGAVSRLVELCESPILVELATE